VKGRALRPLVANRRPPCSPCFPAPASTAIDPKLLVGGAVFGAGWGIGGMCPGPALVALAVPSAPTLAFVAAMLAGMALERRTVRR